MLIDIRDNVREVSRWVDDVHQRHTPFALVYALTLTARDVRDAMRPVMQRVFDRPTPYALSALQALPATRSTLSASVEFREFGGGTPAKRFLNPQVHGGARSRKSHERKIAPLLASASYLVPGRGVARNAYGNVSGAVFRRITSQLKVSSDPQQNASNSRRSKRSRKASAFFVARDRRSVMERLGDSVMPVLVAARAPVYRKRFPFYETGEAIVRQRIAPNFETAFARAMSTSNFRGRWS